MPRLFVAIDFPAVIRQQLALLCHGLRDARWVPEAQLHLTLAFAGEVAGSQVNDLHEALGEIRTAPFDLALHGVGVFPPRGVPHVLWAGVRENPALMQLQQQVEKAIRSAGVMPEKRNYMPHVTLARLNRVPSGKMAEWLTHQALFATPAFPVTELRLYSSVLTPGRAVHRMEAAFPLPETASQDASRFFEEQDEEQE
ncbi:MAG: RNA 2',3'-cyclic phosphodiesterase [Nitrospirota bacterium]|nr:RNA 2',3'-cyclic phosphodiesterase [Nitrospirota bacterium]